MKDLGNSKGVPDCPFRRGYPSFLAKDDEFFMQLAYNEAIEAWEEGEVPVGAVIEFGGEVVGSAHNMVEGLKDPTAHAEVIAITQAARNIGDWRLNGATLYVTKEPCPMCSGAIVMSRITRLVYGARDEKMGFMGGVYSMNEVKTLNHRVNVCEPIMKDKCTELIRTYFELKRKMDIPI